MANGETFEFFFWGHTPLKDGSVNRSCLSQWYEASFTLEGITYRMAEHWMMAGKARLFGDEGDRGGGNAKRSQDARRASA